MFNDNQTKYFLSIGSTGSFTRTAECYNVSRQAVSKAIAVLEEQVGQSLFDRGGQRAALTKAGVMLYEFLTDELGRIEVLKEELNNIKIMDNESLTIGFHDFLPVGTDMSGFLKTSNRKYKVAIELKRYSPATLFKRLAGKRLDMIVVAERYAAHDKQYEKLKIGERSTSLIVSAQHPKATPDATIADFKNEPLIADVLEGESKTEFKARIQKECAICGLAPSAVIEEPNWDSAYINVRMGRGVMISAATNRLLNKDEIKVYDIGAKDAVFCFWRKDTGREKAAEYARFLKEVVGRISVDYGK